MVSTPSARAFSSLLPGSAPATTKLVALLTPLVTLRHDYRVKPDRPPFEFAMYLER